MSRVFIDCPPKGAKVRHTTTYNGSSIVLEGRVFDVTPGEEDRDPYILIGDISSQWAAQLVDRPGEYMVALEVLEPPLPDQPECGTVVLDCDGDAWQLAGVDIDEPGSGVWRCGRIERTWVELNVLLGPLTRLVPDPAS